MIRIKGLRQKAAQNWLVMLFLLAAFASHGQQINIYKTFGGYRFEKDSIAISPKMVLHEMKSNHDAYLEFKKANTNYGIMNAMKFVGGALILFPVASVAVGGDPEWLLAAGGLGLILGSIPVNTSFQRHALNALDIYNGKPTSSNKTQIKFMMTAMSGTIQIKF